MDREARSAEDVAKELRETIPSEGRNRIGKAITGESVTKSTTPQAQVLKRTKLVVGSDGEFNSKEHTRTRDVKPLRNRSNKPDTTLELDIDDDNVKEIN